MVVLDRRGIGAACAMLGGTAWTLHDALLALRPEGCVADGRATSPVAPRPSEDLAWLVVVAVVLMAVAAGLLADVRRRPGHVLVRIGTGALWTGAALLVLGLVVNAVLPGDSPLWWLHDSDSLGRVVPVVGSLLIGIGVLRTGWMAPWGGITLVIAALVSVPFNAQDDRVLLDVPLGLAWLFLGLLGAARREAPGPTRVAAA